MKRAQQRASELDRIATLFNYQVLDTEPDPIFDDMTLLASTVCETPMALVSLVDSDRQWFKSRLGVDRVEIPREKSFCSYTILADEIFEVPDTKLDARFQEGILVKNDPYVRFYAGAPLIAANGHRVGTLCVLDQKPRQLTDVQKQSLKALARTIVSQLEMRLLRHLTVDQTTLFENMKEGVVVQNSEGKVIQFNEAALNILGVTESQMMGATAYDPIWHPCDEYGNKLMPEDHPSVQTRKTGKTIRNRLIQMRTADGMHRWVNVNSAPIRDSNGNIDKIIVTFSDITEQRRLVSELQASEEKFRIIFDNVPVGILKLDSDLNYVEANNAYLKMMGYPFDELKGKSIFDFTHPEDLQNTTNANSHLSKSGKLNKFEKRYITKSGDIIWAEINAQKFEPANIFSVVRDITEERELHAKMLHSSKMSSLGEMAAGVAHEINNPLAIICGNAAVIYKYAQKSKPDLEVIQSKLKLIEETGRRIASIVKGLNTFSRNSENDPFVVAPISHIIADTLSLCHERFRANNIEVQVKYESDPTISCRPTQISQVIMNLLSNSFDSISKLNEKWIQILVSGSNPAVIEVVDSGKTIPREVQAKMMQPFFTTKAVGKGTGLGLSISKGIIEQHQGKIQFCPGAKFVTFKIELPTTTNPPQTTS